MKAKSCQWIRKMTRIRDIKASIRWKIAFASILTLCLSSSISAGLVIIGFCSFYRGELTPALTCLLTILTCILTMLLGGIVLWHASRFVSSPIVQINEGVKEIAKGKFETQIDYTSQDEMGDLARNFNKMAKELSGMDYMRNDFMSNVSHEVKTPVAAITGFAELLMEGGLSKEEEQEYLTYLYEESIRLSRLCDNMLKMSRLDHQALITNEKTFSLDEQIRQCIILLQEKWEKKQIRYRLELAPCKVTSDQDLLYQVWLNLVDNAIKFSDQGGNIKISIKILEAEHKVMVKVKDYGIGMNKEQCQRIFDKFYQGDESHKKEGNGLGLSIVKRIIELIDGRIICKSEPNKGSEFIVILQGQSVSI